MSQSIRWEDDPSYPHGVWLVQLYLIGQEQRATFHQGAWHSADPLKENCFIYIYVYVFFNLYMYDASDQVWHSDIQTLQTRFIQFWICQRLNIL